MVHVHCMIMMAVLFLVKFKASARCNHSEVRLVDGCAPNEGRVEVCACKARSCSWGTVCDDDWDNSDAQVVCRQLGYRSDGAMAFSRAHFGQGHGDISLDDVDCNGGEPTLLDCVHVVEHNCYHWEDAGVKCTGDADSLLLSESITNVSVNITTIINTHGTNFYTILVTWKLQNTSRYRYQPDSFQIECFSHQHRIEMSVNYTTFSIHLVGLLPATSYNCCVSAVYESYTTRGVCIEKATIQPPTSQPSEASMMQPSGSPTNEPGDIISTIKPSESPTVEPGNISTIIPSESSTVEPGNISTIKHSEGPTIQLRMRTCTCDTQGNNSNSVNTLGGVLGFIIAVLLILLAISGAVLVYLLRQRRLVPKESSTAVDRNPTDVPSRTNICYGRTLSHSTTSGPQAIQEAGQRETVAAAEYSRIGPSYEVIINTRRQQPAVAGRNRVPARLSERYEFSEAHLATAGTSGGGQGEVDMDYEVLSMRQTEAHAHDEYSHLQY